MLKRYLLFCQLVLTPFFGVYAQFTVGTNGMVLKESTPMVIDGLTLTPASDLSLSSQNLTISTTPIPGSPDGITRVYTFSQPLTYAGNLGLYYNASELNGNDESLLEIAVGSNSFITTSGSNVNTTTKYISNNLGSPTNFSVVSAAQAGSLPVTLLGFQVKHEGNLATLNWQTSTERQSDFFEIQQSLDAKNWNIVGSVKAATHSTIQQDYHFTDPTPRTGTHYYRLKMMDTNGKYAYSGIRNLRITEVQLLTVYPNPVTDKLRIGSSVDLAKLVLADYSGKMLFQLSKPKMGQEVSMKEYPTGIYYVQIQTVHGHKQVIKILKH